MANLPQVRQTRSIARRDILREVYLTPWVRPAAVFLLLTVVFAVSYAQSPLYTSNQNQYFLHGAAQAGRGYLHEDWLANTLDPTPVFSGLASLTYRYLKIEALFYVYYALQMGVYLASLLGIVSTLYDIRSSRGRFLVYLGLLVTAHSAALRFALAHSVGPSWAYILEDGVAGQRLLGSVFEPSTFGVLLVLSIYLFLRGKPYLAVLSATLAATFHPTYLLSAGALTVGYMWSLFQRAEAAEGSTADKGRISRADPAKASSPQRGGVTRAEPAEASSPERGGITRAEPAEASSPGRGGISRADPAEASSPGMERELAKASSTKMRVLSPLLLGLVALLSVLPVLLYVYGNFGNTPPETTAQAREILVEYRIPHHALIDWWFDATAVVKILIVAAALYLVRKSRLFPLLLVPTLAAAGLSLLQVFLRSNLLALIFPWRLSTFLGPLSTAILLGALVSAAFERRPRLVSRWEPRLIHFSLVVLGLAVFVGGARFVLDLQRKATAEDRPLMNFVARNHASGQVYLTPVKMQDFRLAAGSPVYVDFKSIPYQDADVLEWHRRIQLADQFYKENDCSLLAVMAEEGGVTHVVLEREAFGEACPSLEQVYRDRKYGLYQITNP